MVEMVLTSSGGAALRPTNDIEPLLCRDEVVVGDDEDANRTDFISSLLLLLPTPALVAFDGRRAERASSTEII